MGKRVIITTTRQDPSTPWFLETTHANSVDQALIAEQAFLMNNFNTITFYQTSTDTTLTTTLEFAVDSVFDEYSAIIVDTLASPYAQYCAANNMTFSKVITDI